MTTDREGNIVRRGGWFSNSFRRGERLRSKSFEGQTVDGGSRIISVEDFEYPDNLVIPDIFDNSTEAGKATYGSEMRGWKNSQPYCIGVLLHRVNPPKTEYVNGHLNHDHGIYMHFFDMDGDGVFETRAGVGPSKIPDWVH